MYEHEINIKRLNVIIFLVYFLQAWVSYAIFTVLSYYLGVILLIHPIYIGLIGSIGLIPLVLKIIFAPLIDKQKLPIFSDNKWSWLFFGMVFNGVFLALFAIDIVNFLVVFIIILFLQSTGMVIMDATTDAIAVQRKDRQTSVQPAIGMFMGVLFGGLLSFLFVPIFQFNYPMGYIVMGIIILCFIPLIYKVKGGINFDLITREKVEADWSLFKELFKDRKFIIVMIISILLFTDSGLLEFTLEPYLGLIFGVSLNQIAIIYLISFISNLIVLILFYKFQEQVKNRKILLLIIISLYDGILSLLMSVLIITGVLTFSIFVLIYLLWGITSGALSMLIYILYIDHSSVKIPAFSIMVLISVQNLGRLIGILFGGFIPIGIIYLISAIMLIGRVIPMLMLKKEENE